MIAKKIRNPKKTASKTERITALLKYVRTPECEDKIEKCVYSGTRGFLSDTGAGQMAEMLALAHAAPRSRDPISHYVLSWREDEHPTEQQIERAVDIVLAELGLPGHQVVYTLHRDTDHDHLHLVANRVDPESGRVTQQGLDIEALHRAVARIEHEQGWQRCDNARYAVRENGTLAKRGGEGRQRERRADRKRAEERQEGHHEDSEGPSMSDGARAYERRTGDQSAERIAQERAAPVIARARSWAELHQGLAEIGKRYEKKGSGAIVWVGDMPTPVKASKVARSASLTALERRLGPYEPATAEQGANAKRKSDARPEPPPKDPIVAEYRAARTAWYQERREQRAELRTRHGAEYREMVTHHREQRRELAGAQLRGDAALVGRSLLAQRHAAERAALRDRQRKERQRLAGHFPAIDEWRRQQRRQTGRYRDSFLGNEGTVQPHDIRAFQAEVRGAAVAYHRGDHRAIFSDIGRRVQVHDRQDQEGLVGALQLAAAKWGGEVSVQGSAEFRERAARAAAREGVRVLDEDLAAIVADERERIQRGEPPQARPGAERDPRADELARAQRVAQQLIRDMVTSGDFPCDDAEWARACADDVEVVRGECRRWAEAALEAGWTVSAEALAAAGLDGPDGGAERPAAQDIGR